MTDNKDVVNNEEVTEDAGFDSWENYVQDQLVTIFDAFLPISVGGGITIEYRKAVKEEYEDGTVMLDPDKAVGVRVLVDLEFSGPLDIKGDADETDTEE